MTAPPDGWQPPRPAGTRLSPMTAWDMADRRRPRAGALIPLLIDCGDADAARLARAIEAAGEGEVPPGAVQAGSGTIAALATGAMLARLARPNGEPVLDAIREIEAAAPVAARPRPDTAEAATADPDPARPPDPGTVIVAVIDTGLPLLNAAFRAARAGGPDRSRVHHAWVQGLPPAPGGGVPYGQSFDRVALDRLIAQHSRPGLGLDEVAAYRAAGLWDFARCGGHALGWRRTHGAHVAALAAGAPPAEARADRPLILVDLPAMAVRDTSGRSMLPHLALALDHVFDRAARIARARGCGPLPLVVNFSFGGTGGPLDGTSPIERRMDAMIAARRVHAPTQIVLPAGNGRLAGGHARLPAGTGFDGPDDTAALTWRLPPDDATDTVAEVWTPAGPPAQRLSVALTTPDGAPSPWLEERPGEQMDLIRGGQVIARIRYDHVGDPTGRGRFTLILGPTRRAGDGRPAAPSGDWALRLRDDGLAPGTEVDAWILRDDELPGFDNDARQSRFTDPRCPDRPRLARVAAPGAPGPGCPLMRQGLQNAIATGREPAVAGGYVDRSGGMARYSAGGATCTPDRPGPDAAAVSEDSLVHGGVLSAATLSGGRAAMAGTSVAAPQMARALADAMAAGGTGDRAGVAMAARASEAQDFPDRAPQPAARRAGAGRWQIGPQAARRYRPLD